jgi:dolichol-phosphate mannosyltransferase
MPRVVITGATGFVGANLARRLLADGHEVHVLLRAGHTAWRIETLRSDLRVHIVELTAARHLQQTLSAIAPRWVFHLAAFGAYPHQTAIKPMVETNILGTVNVVEASVRAGAEVIVNSGSSSEYGLKDHPPAETDCPAPNSPYAATKLSSTLLCRELAGRSGVRIPTLRLYSIYGPLEEPTRLIPALVVGGLGGELPPLAHPATARDFVFVDDAVEAYVLAATLPHAEPGPIYNVGTGTQVSLAALVAVARTVLRIPAEPIWGSHPGRAWDTDCWIANSTRLREQLGWAPRYTLEQGLQAFAQWLQDHPRYLQYYRARLATAQAPLARSESMPPV